MKNAKSIVDSRREKILSMINKTGDVKVADISQILQVSEITIRRDLQYLEDKNYIQRYYGGARVISEKLLNTDNLVCLCKDKIARYAASLVEDSDTIFINTSSTALGMLKYITAKNVTVITNNGNAINSQYSSKVTIVLTGGELRHIKGAMVGEFALDSLNKVIAKKSFLGCSGLSLESGMTTQILNEVPINEIMFSKIVQDSYILADYTKIGVNSSFTSCPISMIKNIITDEKADEKTIQALLERDINVHKIKLQD